MWPFCDRRCRQWSAGMHIESMAIPKCRNTTSLHLRPPECSRLERPYFQGHGARHCRATKYGIGNHSEFQLSFLQAGQCFPPWSPEHRFLFVSFRRKECMKEYVNRIGTEKAFQFLEYSSIPVWYAVRGAALLKLKVSCFPMPRHSPEATVRCWY
jgi:hypothetical protein